MQPLDGRCNSKNMELDSSLSVFLILVFTMIDFLQILFLLISNWLYSNIGLNSAKIEWITNRHFSHCLYVHSILHIIFLWQKLVTMALLLAPFIVERIFGAFSELGKGYIYIEGALLKKLAILQHIDFLQGCIDALQSYFRNNTIST